ncbi:MAG TPA: flagellar basal-body rod protein FlgF [Bacteroidota bacterium]|nr:flagellar basal-body rod protein FlgF [Bacteroidota bacterium]
MIKGIFASASGMQPHSVKMEIIANNLANIDTTGFKKDNVFLQVLDEQQMLQRQNSGLGELSSLDAREFTDYSQGSFNTTNNPFDVALLGDGFFAVETPEGVRYTRNGNFSLAQDGTIQNSSGYAVLGTAGVLKIDNWSKLASADISISQHGELMVDKVLVGKLRVVDFPKPYQLEKSGTSLFKPKATTVTPVEADPNTVVKQGMLEESNIDAIEEMVAMIELNRSYETDQRMTTIQDGTLDKALDIGRV